jgi:hypothetical protein
MPHRNSGDSSVGAAVWTTEDRILDYLQEEIILLSAASRSALDPTQSVPGALSSR